MELGKYLPSLSPPSSAGLPASAPHDPVPDAVAGLANEVMKLQQQTQARVDDAARFGEIAAKKEEFLGRAGDLDVELAQNPDHRSYEDRARKGVGKITADVLSGVNDPLVKNHLMQFTSDKRSEYLVNAKHKSWALKVDYSRNAIGKSIDRAVKVGDLTTIDSSIAGAAAGGIWTNLEAAKLRSDAYGGIVKEMVGRGDAFGARAFLDSHTDAFDQADHAALSNAIRPVEAQQAGLTTARALFEANPAANLIDLDAEAYKSLKARPEAYAHAKSELVSLVTMSQAAVKADVDKTEAAAYRAIVPTLLSGGTPTTATIPPATWAKLNEVAPEKAKALMGVIDQSSASAEKKEAEAAFNAVMSIVSGVEQVGKIPRRSDVPEEAWNRLRKAAPDKADTILDELRNEQQGAADRIRILAERPTEAQITTWGAFKLNPKGLNATNLDILLAKGKINRSQYSDLITDQVALRSEKGTIKETAILSDKATVDGILLGAGIKEKEDPAKYMKFYDALEPKRKAFRAQFGKNPDPEQLKTMTRELLAESVREEGILWNSKALLFEADPSKIVVPDSERSKIEAAIRRAGKPVTEDLIRSLYAVKIGISVGQPQ